MGKSQTTDSCKRYDRLLILGLIVFLSGCISDNVADHGALSSYQEQLAGEGSQKRLGEESLQALTPDPEVKLPKLGVVTDANSGINRLNLSIEQAITRTLANSPEIRVVSFEPEIAKEELTGQVAEFDQILFGEYNYNKDDNPINSLTFSDVGQAKTRIWQAGIKQKSVTGSAWSFTWALTRGWDDLATRRYPTRYEPMLSFQLKQPLLRDGWQEVVLAGVNVARLNYEINFAAFRERLENVATQVIKTYWQLLQTRKESQIQQRLLDKTIYTLKRVLDRKDIDATTVQIKQIETSVESRKATLLDLNKRIVDVQDSLTRLLSDTQMNILSDIELVPVTEPKKEKFDIDTLRAMADAVQNNPTIQQTRLELAVANINLDVAKNQKLPRLDIVATAGWQGFAKDRHESYEKLFNNNVNYSSYAVGISFEYPLGNRQRMAQVRKRRLELSRAVSSLQNIADKISLVVKEKVRKIDTSHEQIQTQKAAVEAAEIYLQALEDSEQIRGKLTPEFLLVKLQSQASLANAQQAQIKAVVDFNVALVELAQATGSVLDLHHVQTALR